MTNRLFWALCDAYEEYNFKLSICYYVIWHFSRCVNWKKKKSLFIYTNKINLLFYLAEKFENPQ